MKEITQKPYKKDNQCKEVRLYKSNNHYKKNYLTLIFIWLMIVMPLSAKEIKEPKVWSNGMKVKTIIKEMESETGIKVFLDTTGLPKGYYTAFLFETPKDDTHLAKVYEGVKFNIDNTSKEPLKLNLSMEDQRGNVFKLEEDMPAIIENLQGEKQAIKVEYGDILIPSNFKGTVYVPIAFNHIISYGLTMTMEEEAKREFSFTPLEWIPKGEVDLLEESYAIEIEGKKVATIPNVGETIIPYKGRVSNLLGVEMQDRVKFSLAQKQEGVALTEGGLFKVNAIASIGKVAIKAQLVEKPEWSIIFEVILERPFNENTFYQEMQMPVPLEVTPLTALKPWKFSESHLNSIRSIGGLSLVIVGVFLRWYLK